MMPGDKFWEVQNDICEEALTATHCNALWHIATHCNILRYTATHHNTLHHAATHYNTLQHTATHCNTLQHTATHCNILHHTATHYDTLRRGRMTYVRKSTYETYIYTRTYIYSQIHTAYRNSPGDNVCECWWRMTSVRKSISIYTCTHMHIRIQVIQIYTSYKKSPGDRVCECRCRMTSVRKSLPHSRKKGTVVIRSLYRCNAWYIVCCRVLQGVAGCCRVLQGVAMFRNALQCVAVCCKKGTVVIRSL